MFFGKNDLPVPNLPPEFVLLFLGHRVLTYTVNINKNKYSQVTKTGEDPKPWGKGIS